MAAPWLKNRQQQEEAGFDGAQAGAEPGCSHGQSELEGAVSGGSGPAEPR